MNETTNKADAAIRAFNAVAKTWPAIDWAEIERPTIEWTPEKLGEFAQAAAKRNATSAWEIGRAAVLAKKKSRRNFGKWVETYLPFLSKRTVERYMNVGELDYDNVKGEEIGKIYELLYGEDYDRKKTTEAAGQSPPPAADSGGGATPPAAEPEAADLAEAGKGEAENNENNERLKIAIGTLKEVIDDPAEWEGSIDANRADLTVVAEGLVSLLAA